MMTVATMNLIGLFWVAFGMFFIFQFTVPGLICVVDVRGIPPSPPRGYLARKSLGMIILQMGCACKIFHSKGLCAKYLFCCSCGVHDLCGFERLNLVPSSILDVGQGVIRHDKSLAGRGFSHGRGLTVF